MPTAKACLLPSAYMAYVMPRKIYIIFYHIISYHIIPIIQTYTDRLIHTQTYTDIHIHTQTDIHRHLHTHTYTDIHIHTHTDIHIHTQTDIPHADIHTQTHTNRHTHTAMQGHTTGVSVSMGTGRSPPGEVNPGHITFAPLNTKGMAPLSTCMRGIMSGSVISMAGGGWRKGREGFEIKYDDVMSGLLLLRKTTYICGGVLRSDRMGNLAH